MAKNKLTKILTAPDKDIKKTFGANGVLSRLFRQMLLDLNIGPSRFGSLLQEYILDPRNGVPNNKKDQTSMRGNLTKEFSRPQMTWKVFCKALRFLQIKKIEFVIKAHHRIGKSTIHSSVVDFGGGQQEIDIIDAGLDEQGMALKAHHRNGKASLHSAAMEIDLDEPDDNEGERNPLIGTQYEVQYLDIDVKTGQPFINELPASEKEGDTND
jgi:hypothetical protein